MSYNSASERTQSIQLKIRTFRTADHNRSSAEGRLPVRASVCQPTCPPACLPTRLPACLPACLSAYVPAHRTKLREEADDDYTSTQLNGQPRGSHTTNTLAGIQRVQTEKPKDRPSALPEDLSRSRQTRSVMKQAAGGWTSGEHRTCSIYYCKNASVCSGRLLAFSPASIPFRLPPPISISSWPAVFIVSHAVALLAFHFECAVTD